MVDGKQVQAAVAQLPTKDHGSLHQAAPQPSEATSAEMSSSKFTSPTATEPSPPTLKPVKNAPSASATATKKNPPPKQARKAGSTTQPKSRMPVVKAGPATTPKSTAKSGSAQQKPAKPPKIKPAASKSSSSKTSAKGQQTPVQAAGSKPRKPKAKQKLDDPTLPSPTGPTLSDGKVERLIWQLSDGNGDPTPDIVEKTRSKKTGHPTWKLFTGRNVPKVPTPTNPPRFVYLDDKAAWDISCSKDWTAHEKHRFWPFDFTPQGKISLVRPNRGRPAYEDDGRTYASLKKRQGERYWFHGCHPPPNAGGSSALAVAPTATAAVAEGSNSTAPEPPAQEPPPQAPAQPTTSTASSLTKATQSDIGTLPVGPEVQPTTEANAPEISRSPTPNTAGFLLEELSTGGLGNPTPPPSGQTELVPARVPSHEHEPTLSESSQAPRPLPANEPRPDVTVFPTSHLEATSSLPPRQIGTYSPNLGPSSHETPAAPLIETSSPTQRPNSTVSTSPATSTAHMKRSNSPTELPLPVPKRQRKALHPANIPAAVHAQDNEFVQIRKMLQAALNRERKKDNQIASLQQQLAIEQATNVNSSRLLEASEKEGAAFRELAQKLYARAVDQHSALVDRQEASLRLLADVNALKAAAERAAITTRRELQPTEALAKDVDEVLDRVEENMKDQGLEREFDLFAKEAMLLED